MDRITLFPLNEIKSNFVLAIQLAISHHWGWFYMAQSPWAA
jgi:hypothetical protein